MSATRSLPNRTSKGSILVMYPAEMQACSSLNVRSSGSAWPRADGHGSPRSPRQLGTLEAIDEGRATMSIDEVSHLPLLDPDIGHRDERQWRRTLLVAQQVVQTFMRGDEAHIAFDPPEAQDAPVRASILADRETQRRMDAWQAALVHAAGRSAAPHVVCSTYTLQAAARHELRSVLGYKRLARQRCAFTASPCVTLHANTPPCALATDVMWAMLDNIHVLALCFRSAGVPAQQHALLNSMPCGSIRCLSLTGLDVHDAPTLTLLCAVMRRVRELEALHLVGAAELQSDDSPLPERAFNRFSNSILRPYRIVAVDCADVALQGQVCGCRCDLYNTMPTHALCRCSTDRVARHSHHRDSNASTRASAHDAATQPATLIF
jgi:hypothetical protein